MARILIVDDEQPMRELIQFYLVQNGFETVLAASGKEALSQLLENAYDLMIVDWMMPEMDGLELCQQIRRFSQIPIIMLTARNQLEDKVEGFEKGADDYLSKPFEEAELIARIKALLRRARSQQAEQDPILRYKDLTLNEKSYEVVYRNQVVLLTAHEFELLKFMMKHVGQVLSREQMIENVWGFDFEGDNRTVDSHIRNLRSKLKSAGGADFIKTVWGVGYKLK
ncbi:response regulator transcription factor [Effusibacillus dendaii]|uniref:DNA-binding response regulator n=1 Tax=Effusibacillus dendaii TaxID=2743772 RepID=A0A7I8DDS7_9BACL|nr:response regulator transcription factor [Effusibacillus dendaii]BCJ88348.1 DNA-binding response regulator [Effusibacillus dendaii]